jgi:lipid A 3-O-deacylase
MFGGEQFSPSDDWCFGFTPHLRYNLATGTRLVPFVDGGAGVTVVGVEQPDLSSTFEFNLQGGTGVHYFVRDNLAVAVEARYLHISDAGIRHPNDGLNGVGGMIGLTWFF